MRARKKIPRQVRNRIKKEWPEIFPKMLLLVGPPPIHLTKLPDHRSQWSDYYEKMEAWSLEVRTMYGAIYFPEFDMHRQVNFNHCCQFYNSFSVWCRRIRNEST